MSAVLVWTNPWQTSGFLKFKVALLTQRVIGMGFRIHIPQIIRELETLCLDLRTVNYLPVLCSVGFVRPFGMKMWKMEMESWKVENSPLACRPVLSIKQCYWTVSYDQILRSERNSPARLTGSTVLYRSHSGQSKWLVTVKLWMIYWQKIVC